MVHESSAREKEQFAKDSPSTNMSTAPPESTDQCPNGLPILVRNLSVDKGQDDDASNTFLVDNLVTIDGSDLTKNSLKSCHILNPRQETRDPRVMFFDLDNTLYPISTGIAQEMGRRIELFFQEYLHLPGADAATLGCKFYLDYGLAIKGLIKHFAINPQDYDEFVDGGLQLEKALRPNKKLKNMLSRIRARKWIFTNAGLQHSLRVLQLLGIQDQFEGIIYCDYCEPDFPAKPDRLAYERAMRCAGVDPDHSYFVDDGVNNVRTAVELGWHAILVDEMGEFSTTLAPGIRCIANVGELESVLGELFKR